MTMPYKEWLQKRQCEGKRSYYSWQAARSAAHYSAKTFKQSPDNWGAYGCTWCGAIHVGHKGND